VVVPTRRREAAGGRPFPKAQARTVAPPEGGRRWGPRPRRATVRAKRSNVESGQYPRSFKLRLEDGSA
jgi:hypothetical protein